MTRRRRGSAGARAGVGAGAGADAVDRAFVGAFDRAVLRAVAGALARFVVAFVLCAGASGAGAHATLVTSEPADGARLPQPPAQAMLRFDEPVVPGAIRLLDRGGAPLTLPVPPQANDTEVHVALPAALPDGHYVLAWRVTSTDSHLIGGALAFTVGAAAADAAVLPLATPAAPAATAPRVLRVVHLVALLAAAGGVLFVLLVAPLPGGGAWLAGAALLGAASALAGVWLQGAALADASASAVETWRAGFATTRGDSALVALAGAALLGIGIGLGTRARHPRACRLLLALGALLLVASPALTGHTAAARPPTVAPAAAVVHVAFVAFWFASLVTFSFAAPRWRVAGGRDALEQLQRFSRLALPGVVLLMAAALVLAWLQLRPTPAAEWLASDYARWIVVKLALLAALIVLAALNRFRWLHRALAGSAAARRRLRASIGVELVLMLAAIGAAAWLATTPPPRAGAAVAGSGTVAEASRDGWRARIAVFPARPGPNVVDIAIDAAIEATGGAAREPQEVRIEFAQPAAGVVGLERRPAALGRGRYRWTGPELAFAGEWEVVVRARIDDFETRDFTLKVRIAP